MENVISPRVIKILDRIEVGKSLNEKILRIAEKEVRRKINRYEFMIKAFEKKYGTNFESFKKKAAFDKEHKWEIERDYSDWEMAETELKELKKILENMRK